MKGPKDGEIKVKSQYKKMLAENSNVSGIYLVSVGKKYHEGAFLSAALEFMSNNFDKYNVVVADTLQRHNYPQRMDPAVSYEMAYAEGESWLKRNHNIIANYKKNQIISRWDSWLNHPLYQSTKKIINKLVDNRPVIAAAFRETAVSFLSKRKSEITEVNISSSIEYLKEECAIIIPIWSNENIDRIVYPGKLTPALGMIYTYYKEEHNKANSRWFPISFKRYSIAEKV